MINPCPEYSKSAAMLAGSVALVCLRLGLMQWQLLLTIPPLKPASQDMG